MRKLSVAPESLVVTKTPPLCDGVVISLTNPRAWIGENCWDPCQNLDAFREVIQTKCQSDPRLCRQAANLLLKSICATPLNSTRGRINCGEPLADGKDFFPTGERPLTALPVGWAGVCKLTRTPLRTRRSGTGTKCNACLKTTRTGNKLTQTLVYYSLKPDCVNHTLSPCVYNNTQYSQCHTKQGIQCYLPQALGPITASIYVYGYKGGSDKDAFQTSQNRGGYLAHNSTRGGGNVSVCFDACKAIASGQGHTGNAWTTCGSLGWEREYMQNQKYLCQRRKIQSTGQVSFQDAYDYWYSGTLGQTPTWPGPEGINITLASTDTGCQAGKCNPICLSAHPTSSPTTKQYVIGLGIDGRGKDPYGYLSIQVKTESIKREAIAVFSSFFEEMQTINHFPIPPKAHNMFIELTGTIAQEFNLTNCFVCGGTNMGDQWPWLAQEANYTELNQSQANFTYRHPGNEAWTISNNIIGNECFQRNQTSNRTHVGTLVCLGIWNNSTWYGPGNLTKRSILADISNMSFLSKPEEDLEWTTPDGLYWICGNTAYNKLPGSWYGACMLGTIRPGFFLLPLKAKQQLGVPVYNDIMLDRKKRADVQIGNWKDNEWPPERIIHYYDPASWAQDGSWGYRTPIYILNRLIRLQAVVEIITNQTAQALQQLAKESIKSRTYIMQNRLALDYLLAQEGGVCGKFNLTNCCIEIDDSGKVVKEITNKMVRIAHVPVQTWDGFNFKEMFGSWFPKLPGLQAIVALIGIIAAGCVLIPCILPIFVKTISNTLSLITERENRVSKVEAKMMLLEFETRMKRKRGDCESEPERSHFRTGS